MSVLISKPKQSNVLILKMITDPLTRTTSAPVCKILFLLTNHVFKSLTKRVIVEKLLKFFKVLSRGEGWGYLVTLLLEVGFS